MTDIGDLLRQHGAPLPKAIPMNTEVRSEGALMLQQMNVPEWARTISASLLTEWRCTLSREDVRALQCHLKTLLPHGVTVQEAINEAFKKLDIGSYLGTFIEEGLLVDGQAKVHVLFAYQSSSANSLDEINQRIHSLLTDQGSYRDTGDALQKLREIWRRGTDKWEGGMMMLSEINLYDPGRFPYTRAALITSGTS
jgi:hypothetical protein